MTKKSRRITEDEALEKDVEDFMGRFRRELALRPEVSDKEFLEETEVSDECYEHGLGAIPPAGGEHISLNEVAEEGYMDDPDPANATILFQMWEDRGIKPNELEKGYEGVESYCAAWLKKVGA